MNTQAICESMGWDKYRNPSYDIRLAKLLQSRLVEEGWSISVHQLHDPREDDKPFMAYGYKADGQNVSSEWTASEPSAILALYCKVHGIEGDK